jgi:ribosome maturation factor RimP
MDLKKIAEQVTAMIKPILDEMGIELFDLQFSRGNRKSFLKITIDKDAGIGIEDCERVSREISPLLELNNLIPYSYVVEVSSPGLDRPLRKKEDFVKHRGKLARIATKQPIEKQSFFIGRIQELGDESVSLLLSQDKEVAIEFINISKARLEVEF